ncbi:unnamed protein product [Urochloa humidicola]
MRKVFALVALAVAALLAAAGGASGQQSIITQEMFESMLSHRGDGNCDGAFYTYDAFTQAAARYPDFGTTGDDETRRRELAAFFGQTSHETTGGWAAAPDGPFAWGYCRVKEQNPTDPPYYGRGPIQLTHRAGVDAGPGGQSGPGVEQPRGVLRDGHLVLDDAAGGKAVVPRRDHQQLDAQRRRQQRGEDARVRHAYQHHQRRAGVRQGHSHRRRQQPGRLLQQVLPDAWSGRR